MVSFGASVLLLLSNTNSPPLYPISSCCPLAFCPLATLKPLCYPRRPYNVGVRLCARRLLYHLLCTAAPNALPSRPAPSLPWQPHRWSGLAAVSVCAHGICEQCTDFRSFQRTAAVSWPSLLHSTQGAFRRYSAQCIRKTGSQELKSGKGSVFCPLLRGVQVQCGTHYCLLILIG